MNKEKNDQNQQWKLLPTTTPDVYFISKYVPGPGGTEMCVTWVQSQKFFQLKPRDFADTKQYFRFEQVLGGNTTSIYSADDNSVYAVHSDYLVGPGATDTQWSITS
ncbi:18643_t:CDS:1 [Acaulospora morrowiae]|uniref:18643_t:CDS:1 n=1 Tax=Acaulospora morrowiae TaxID=94023 RepID=A0A9N9D2K2_9GLOM|nr:18643_t:CDS:1 [Acaulospora morrowiae]